MKINSDSQQCHQCQQNEQSYISSLLIEHKKKITTYDVGKPDPEFLPGTRCGGVQ